MGEGYLRDDKTAAKAVATLEQVKQGYEGLLSCFDNLEGFDNQQAQLQTLQSQWQGYGIGGDVADEVKAMEKQMAEAVMQGQECQTVKLTREAIAGYENLTKTVEPVLAAEKSAQNAKNDWLSYAKKYGFTGKSPSAKQAQQAYDEGQQQKRIGDLPAALSPYGSAAQSWLSAKQDKAVVAHVKKKEQAWAAERKSRAAAEAERRRLAAAEAERKREAAARAERERQAALELEKNRSFAYEKIARLLRGDLKYTSTGWHRMENHATAYLNFIINVLEVKKVDRNSCKLEYLVEDICRVRNTGGLSTCGANGYRDKKRILIDAENFDFSGVYIKGDALHGEGLGRGQWFYSEAGLKKLKSYLREYRKVCSKAGK